MKVFIVFLASVIGVYGCARINRYLLDQDYMYRQLHADSWVESGGDAQVINATIEKIRQLNSRASYNVDMATIEYKSGNWQYEWDKVAKEAVFREDYRAATTYYTIAAYPFLNNDNLSNRSYGFALSNYKKMVKQDGNYIEELSIETPKGTAYAYLHLPDKQPDSRLPLLIVTNGSDHSLTSLYSVYSDYLKSRGWAMISFDLPGLGSNIHIGINTDETNYIHQYLLEHIKGDARIDRNRVALMASSFGGNAATKTAFTNPNDIAAVVNICGATNAPFLDIEFALKEVPRMTGDAFLQRFDMSKEEVIKTGDELALSTHYIGKVKTTVPILSVNHEDDDISPISDMELISSSSLGGKHVVVDKGTDEGHCPADEKALKIAMDWLDKRFVLK